MLKREGVSEFKNEALFVQDGYRIAAWIGRSDGSDGAFVAFIDTNFEPDGSDNGPGLRVMINDDDTYVGVPYGTPTEEQLSLFDEI